MISTTTKCVFLCLGTFLFAFVGCERSHMASKMITAIGTYPSPDKKYNLSITVNSDGIVLYEICASGSSAPLVNGKVGSVYTKFYFMWDDNNNVWIEGEQAGRIIFFEHGKFRSHDMTVADFKDPTFPKAPPEWDINK